MLFSSIIFLFAFLPLVLGIYFLLHERFRNTWLLITSLLFYAWGEPRLILVMLASILFNYVMGLLVGWTRGSGWCKVHLTSTVIGNLALIGYFKYFNFFTDTFNHLAEMGGLPPVPVASVILPLGISFYTFHALSYVIDIYRGECPPQRNLFTLGLYIAFFPQSIAGPIVRYHEVAGQLTQRMVTAASFATGIERFIIGLAKKILLANLLALAADAVFDLSAAELTTPLAWFGMLAYTLQIYFDFSGYSDMAIGLALMFGFKFPENFNYPYSAQSMTDFWRRWHISLSSWFRDYLYIPLGGNRGGQIRTMCNLTIVFLLCGLWHGASWTFVLWGVVHGLFLVAERISGQTWPARLPWLLRHAYTLLAVMLAWVLFRANDLTHAGIFYTALCGLQPANELAIPFGVIFDTGMLIVLAISCLAAVPWWHKFRRAEPTGTAATEPVSRWAQARYVLIDSLSFATLLTFFVICTFRLLAQTHNPFIYFRF